MNCLPIMSAKLVPIAISTTGVGDYLGLLLEAKLVSVQEI